MLDEIVCEFEDVYEMAEAIQKLRAEKKQLINEIEDNRKLIAENHPILSNCVAVFKRFKNDSIEGVIVSNDIDADQVVNMRSCYPTIAESFMESYVEDAEDGEIIVKPINI